MRFFVLLKRVSGLNPGHLSNCITVTKFNMYLHISLLLSSIMDKIMDIMDKINSLWVCLSLFKAHNYNRFALKSEQTHNHVLKSIKLTILHLIQVNPTKVFRKVGHLSYSKRCCKNPLMSKKLWKNGMGFSNIHSSIYVQHS